MGRRGKARGTEPEEVMKAKREAENSVTLNRTQTLCVSGSVPTGNGVCVGSATSCCLSQWETIIAHDHFLFPNNHLSFKAEMHRLYYGPHERGGEDGKKERKKGTV